MRGIQLRIADYIDLDEFCSSWENYSDRYEVRCPMNREYIIIHKDTRYISNKGYSHVITCWIEDGVVIINEK